MNALLRSGIRGASMGLVVASLVAATFALPHSGRACTTGVVSGKATPDGRPLLWKNRDTSHRDNQVAFFRGTKYRYMGVINAGSRGAVWMGVNEAGFCIENSLVRTLPGGNSSGPGNGPFMKRALATCATVEDFEALLKETNDNGRRTNSNFGVIDAQGGAAIFEAGHKTYKKFDANDPETAPEGYIVRSNFAMTCSRGRTLEDGRSAAEIYSGERYLRADALFTEAVRNDRLDYRYILRNCGRDLADEHGDPYCRTVNGSCDGPLPDVIDTRSTICRRTTVSATVFHGVKPGEDPLLTTMWVILGDPAFSAAVPCWVATEGVAEPLLGKERSPLCTLAVELRDANYIDGERLETGRLPETWDRLWTVEDRIFARTDTALNRWRRRMPTSDEMFRIHESAATEVHDSLKEINSRMAEPAAATAGP